MTEDTALSQVNQEPKRLTSLRTQTWVSLPRGGENVTFRTPGGKCLGVVNGISLKTVACNGDNTIFNIFTHPDGSSWIRPVQNGAVAGTCVRLVGPVSDPGPFFFVADCVDPIARFYFDKIL